jgi:hypothetical protein
MYDASIGRWNGVDALAEGYKPFTSYSFALNNPVKLTDKDGNIVRDQNGNVVFTASSTPPVSTGDRIVDAKSNPDGTMTYTVINTTYQEGNIYADNGTAVSAYQFVEGSAKNITVNSSGEPISIKSIDINSLPLDCVSDCHGLTFADNKLWIDNTEVNTILDNDDYQDTGIEHLAGIVIFSKGGAVVHSAIRNPDGTYDNNAGISTTERGKTLSEAARGMTDVSKIANISLGVKGNVQFYFKRSNARIIDTQLGTVKNGVRKITDEEEIKKFLQQLGS